MNFISLKQPVNRLGLKKTWIPAFAGMTSIYMKIIMKIIKNPYDNRAPSQNLRRSCPAAVGPSYCRRDRRLYLPSHLSII